MARRTRSAPITAVDETLVSGAERQEIQKAAEEVVRKERKRAAEQEILADSIDAVRAKFDPQYTKVPILIDLPAFTGNLLVDGSFFYHGQTVMVTTAQAASLRDIMSSMWIHERVSGNPNASKYSPIHAADPVSANAIARV